MGSRALLAVVTVLALAACGERRDVQPVAQPAPPQAPDTASMGAGPSNANCGIAALPQEALDRINAARAAGHRCGARRMAPTFPLKWDPALYSAASGHSLDMAKRNYFDHRSPSGVTVNQRASASNYNWKTVGENLAGGDTSVAEVVQGWLDSPEHCENLMDPTFNDMAVACVAQPGTQWGTYWTMMLGRKR
jgi:uncharacterized protein YkwD